MIEYCNYINGEFVDSEGADRIKVTNPASGEVISSVPETHPNQVESAISAAEKAQPAWAALPAVARARHLHQLADKIREKVEPLARVITEEQGKTLPLARVEVNFTADYIDYMAEWGRRIEGDVIESDRPKETTPFSPPSGLALRLFRSLPQKANS